MLVVVEVALSLALLLAAGLFVRSLRDTQSVSPGFDVDKIISAPLNINLLRYTRDQGREFYRTVVERVEAIPGVESASVARTQVLTLGRIVSLRIEGRAGSSDVFRSEGGTPSAGSRRDAVNSNVIGPGYFETMGIGLRDRPRLRVPGRRDGASGRRGQRSLRGHALPE